MYDFQGTIADYTPNVSPMIPALIIHCVNEVEARGLTEVGLYRVPGSEKEVKALKVLTFFSFSLFLYSEM